MRVVSADPGLDLAVRVDPEAEPSDWDAAILRFLLAYVRSRAARSAGTAAVEVDPERQ